ncbi:MAG: molybdopterin-dependent oxidoreductase [Anaerolineae bacterium]|nr:molybdopterin-dependent oxidoreductase [Anaerolineae bacterium]
MNKHRILNGIWVLALVVALAACVQQSPTATAVPPTATSVPPTATTVPPTATPAAPALEIVGDEGSKSFTLEELMALPVTEGQGGIKSSTGKITVPELFTGVSLKDLVAALGAFDENMGVNVVAEDGYGITFSYDQVMNGAFIAYDPGTGDEIKSPDPLTAILAYARNGEPLDPKQDGTLRLVVVSAKNNQVTDGHWSVKWVNKLEVKALGQEWTLHLEGTIVEEMDRATFESGASPNCHGATWTDDHAQRWVGIPLWLLVGRVDDEISHNGPAFNEVLADAGYTVDVIAADGYTVSFDSARIKRNDKIIVAYKVNDNPLPEQYFPLRLVGEDLEKKEMAGMIAQIVVHVEGIAISTPTPEPTPPPAPVTVEGDLVIVGLVDQPLGLIEETLRAMEVVKITAEHPKKGQEEYEGVRLNALLDQAGVQESATKLVVTAADGFVVEVFVAEVRDCADCLLAFTETPGKFKLVMPGLPSSVWAKDVVQIKVQ